MSYNPFTLSGKVILVTGASSGIGKSISIELSKMGAQLIISGRNEARLIETMNSLQGINHTFVSADLTIENELKILIDQLPQLDGLVLSAGIVKTILFQYITLQDIKEIMDVNFFSPVILINMLVKLKKINKGASIIFISSISGNLCTWAGNSIYSASKAAINGIAKGLALDLAKKSIRVNTIMPGMIESDILDNNLITKEQIVEDVKNYPLKRYGKTDEIAYAAIYLLSDTTRWVTGTNLLIDGGYTLK
jgi:NAD(P)-dependent dehydrogenase (short-subunit alcohol dehydrogenase family)